MSTTAELPEFIIGGAPRCGATYLAAQMRQQQDVCTAVTKEHVVRRVRK